MLSCELLHTAPVRGGDGVRLHLQIRAAKAAKKEEMEMGFDRVRRLTAWLLLLPALGAAASLSASASVAQELDSAGIAALDTRSAPTGSTALANGVPVYGLEGAAGEEQRFFLEVPAGAAAAEFSIVGVQGDADLYVKFGSEPTVGNSDCQPTGGSIETCRFDAPQAGTYHVLVRGFTTFFGVTLTGGYEGAGGAGPVSGKLLKIKQYADKPHADKLSFRSNDPSIAAPPAGGSADPLIGGGRLVVTNPATAETATLELPASSWLRNANGHLTSQAGGCSVKLKAAGRLKVSCVGTNLGFTLDEAYQGNLAVKLELGAGVVYCAGFGGQILKDSGIGWDGESSPGRFHARNAPRPASCAY
jgi:hypothetical protein